MKSLSSIIAKPYFVTWLVFVILTLLFAIFVFVRGSADCFPVDIERALTAIFIGAVHILVTVNTLIFIMEIYRVVPRPSDLEVVNNSSATTKHSYASIALIILALSIFVSGAAAYRGISFGFSKEKRENPTNVEVPTQPTSETSSVEMTSAEKTWHDVLHINEWLVVILFGLFVLAGWLVKTYCDLPLKEEFAHGIERRRELDEFSQTATLYAAGCDRPGLVGAVLILILSTLLRQHGENYQYLEGFLAGAMVLHVAFSQTSLAFMEFTSPNARPA